MNNKNQQQIKVSIAIVIIAAALAILSILASSISDNITGKLFMTCYSLIVFGLFAAPCWVVAENPAYKGLGMAGIITAGLGFLITLITILGGVDDGDILKFIFVLFIASLALAQISFLFHIKIQNKYAGYARITATIAIAIFSFIIITQLFQSLPSLYMLGANQGIFKLVGGLFIANLAAILLVPLCNRLHVEEPAQEFSFTEEQPPAQTEETTEQ